MKDLIVDILKIIAPVSVAVIVFCQGLEIAPGEVTAYFKQRAGLMLRSLIAVLIVAPLVALAVILAFKPAPAVAVGLAIVAACPPAPLMLSTASKLGKGSAAFMASLHLSLALLAFLTVPALLFVLSEALSFEAQVNFSTMAWILGRTILIPILLGIGVRATFPRFADRIGRILSRLGMTGVVVVVLFVLVAFFPALLKMEPWSYLVIALTGAATLAVGHLLGPSDPREKTSLAIECGVRHPALAITIAAENFGLEKTLPVLAPVVLTLILVAVIYMVVRGRTLAAPRPERADAVS